LKQETTFRAFYAELETLTRDASQEDVLAFFEKYKATFESLGPKFWMDIPGVSLSGDELSERSSSEPVIL